MSDTLYDARIKELEKSPTYQWIEEMNGKLAQKEQKIGELEARNQELWRKIAEWETVPDQKRNEIHNAAIDEAAKALQAEEHTSPAHNYVFYFTPPAKILEGLKK